MENKGFTLIELLIVIAIIGILVGIALPSYQAHVRKANRIDMQFAMTKMSLIAERQYARQNDYPAAGSLSGYVEVPNTYLASIATGIKTDVYKTKWFLITATPVGGQQLDDCGTMTLDQTGTTSAALVTCW